MMMIVVRVGKEVKKKLKKMKRLRSRNPRRLRNVRGTSDMPLGIIDTYENQQC
jgi:hypothetical protein